MRDHPQVQTSPPPPGGGSAGGTRSARRYFAVIQPQAGVGGNRCHPSCLHLDLQWEHPGRCGLQGWEPQSVIPSLPQAVRHPFLTAVSLPDGFVTWKAGCHTCITKPIHSQAASNKEVGEKDLIRMAYTLVGLSTTCRDFVLFLYVVSYWRSWSKKLAKPWGGLTPGADRLQPAHLHLQRPPSLGGDLRE